VDTPRDFDLETRTFRDSGARDPEGRRIFLEDGQPERALVAGPTLGYRAWLVKDGALWSTGAGKQRWGPGQPLAAVCVAKQVVTPDPRGFKLDVHFRSSHEGIPAPWRPCSCGVYAIRRREDLERVAGAGTIVGQVALWGHVIEHQRGYRAQYAYPVRLWAPAREGIVGTMVPLPPGFPHLRSEGERLADLYGVPWGAPPEGGSA
jgi:hypothetical protein